MTINGLLFVAGRSADRVFWTDSMRSVETQDGLYELVKHVQKVRVTPAGQVVMAAGMSHMIEGVTEGVDLSGWRGTTSSLAHKIAEEIPESTDKIKFFVIGLEPEAYAVDSSARMESENGAAESLCKPVELTPPIAIQGSGTSAAELVLREHPEYLRDDYRHDLAETLCTATEISLASAYDVHNGVDGRLQLGVIKGREIAFTYHPDVDVFTCPQQYALTELEGDASLEIDFFHQLVDDLRAQAEARSRYTVASRNLRLRQIEPADFEDIRREADMAKRRVECAINAMLSHSAANVEAYLRREGI